VQYEVRDRAQPRHRLQLWSGPTRAASADEPHEAQTARFSSTGAGPRHPRGCALDEAQARRTATTPLA